MPKIADKRKVLGGRGSVVLYASGTSAGQYFYRELIKGTKNYMTRRIEGCRPQGPINPNKPGNPKLAPSRIREG